MNPNELFDLASTRRKIGHITPSSNTVLEPITAIMNASLTNAISHHFARIQVKQLTTGAETSSQFTTGVFADAADLLSHLVPDAIVWNGTSGSWLGFDHDEACCRAISGRTGVPASTSTLAFETVVRQFGFERVALAVPYVTDLTERIREVYASRGLNVVGEAHLGQTINIEIGRNAAPTIRRLLRDAARFDADCIAVVCTNLAAAPLVEEMEVELGVPILDSVAVTFWEACRLVGVKPALLGWGALLRGSL